MANEITIHTKLSLKNGNTNKSIANRTVRVDQSAAVAAARVHTTEQVVGTSEEALSVGDVATVGIVYLRNLDATNTVNYGTVTGNLGFELPPGEQAMVRVKSGSSILVQALVAACKLEVGVLAD